MRRSILLTFLLLLAASTASAQKLQAVKRLMVVDASGKKVGDVLPSAAVTGNGAYVAFRINGNLVPLFVRKFGIEGHGGDVYFPSDDCLGAPFMTEQGAFAPLVSVAGPGWTVYVAQPEDGVQTILVRSQRRGVTPGCRNLSFPRL